MSVGSGSLLSRVRDYARETGLFPESGLALLAVSGGPDSVALLDIMVRLAPDLGLRLALVHVDHGILDESADIAEQVLGLSVRYKLPGYLFTLNLGKEASETVARRERYLVLRQCQSSLDARYLVTGHHADDQVETVLFRLMRGTGTAGLAGILPRSPDGLVRPLLPFRKTELLGWLEGQAPHLLTHSDPANADSRHHRSWIRGTLLPVLRERFGSDLDDHLMNVGRHAADDRQAWRALLRSLPELEFREAGGVLEIARAPLVRYDKSLSQAILRSVGRELGCVIGARRAARLLTFVQSAPSGRTFQLGRGGIAETAFDRVRFFILKEAPAADDGGEVLWGDGHEGCVAWRGWRVRWSREPAGEIVRDSLVTWVSEGRGEIRPIRPGDRISPLGGTGRRRVSRVLMEGRVPRSARLGFPLLIRGDRVIWLPGICRSDGALPAAGEPAMRLEAHAD